MIRCIQISTNGPIVQGDAEIVGLRNFHTGQQEPTGRATIAIGPKKITGTLIASVRTP